MRKFKTYSRYSRRFENPDKQGWNLATATVVACRRSFLSFFEAGRNPGDPAAPIDYVATFEYEVKGKKYYGRMGRGTPVNPGHHFTISYDPDRPARNTGSDNQGPWWFHLAVWTIGLAMFALLIYLDRLVKS